MIQGHTTEGQAGPIQHPSLLQAKVALRMLRRVIHQPQMGQIRTQRLLHELGIVAIEPDVAVHHQEGIVAEQRQRLANTAGRLQPSGLFL